MRIYMAALYHNFHDMSVLTEHEQKVVNAAIYRLESFHYLKPSGKGLDGFRQRVLEFGHKIFLDSGAFSAFSLGAEIDIAGYCQFIKANPDIVDFPSVLDGIGDPFKTYQNQVVMEKLGTHPLPCFHFGEDERYLEYYVANYKFITLGGMVPHTTQENQMWLDRMWSKYLCHKDGSPRIKVHGFGMTSPKLMMRYPWFSVDSSSWVHIAAFGNIIFDDIGVLPISNENPSRKEANKHFDSLPGAQQDGIVRRIESRGFDVDRLRTDTYSRRAFNIQTFGIMQEQLMKKELRNQADQPTLF
jgi:hypothetical protein